MLHKQHKAIYELKIRQAHPHRTAHKNHMGYATKA